MNDTSFNWTKFLLLLAAKVTSAFSRLTRPERVRIFVLDDSVIKRNRSKAVELLARVYDHGVVKVKKKGKGKTVRIVVQATDGSGKKAVIQLKIRS